MKKMLCLLLALILLIPGTVLANEEKPLQIQLNGVNLEFEVPPKNINGRLMVPFRAIAEKSGASVEFIDETRKITATKGMKTVTFTLDETDASVKDNLGERTIEMEVAPAIIEDRALIPLRFFAEGFGMDVGWDRWENTAVLVDYSAFVQRFKEKNTKAYQLFSLPTKDLNFAYQVSVNTTAKFDSKTFGVNLSAGNFIDLDFKIDNNNVILDANILNDGLYNLYTLFTQIRADMSDDEDSYTTPDFYKPMNIKLVFLDGEIYVQSEFIIGLFLDSYEYRYLDKAYKNELKTKWLKLTNDEINIKDLDLIQFYNTTGDEKLEYYFRAVLPNLGYSYKDSADFYKEINAKYEAFESFMSDDRHTFTNEADSSTSITYQIDEKALYPIIKNLMEQLMEDDEYKEKSLKYLDEFFAQLHFNWTSMTKLRDNMTQSATSDIAVKIDNFPTPYKIEVGTLEISTHADGKTSQFGEVSITKDTLSGAEVIDQAKLKNDALQARIKYYRDEGYTVDEEGNVDYRSKWEEKENTNPPAENETFE